MIQKKQTLIDGKLLLGRHEWCQLPGLDVPAIKAKIDTGAKTSAIHAFNIKPVTIRGKEYVSFDIHPIQKNDDVLIHCKALVVDERDIMSSNGHKEHRYVIVTLLRLGQQAWEIEVTLSNRDPLRFRMLLGREALNGRVLIDPSALCQQGTLKKDKLMALYPVG